MKACTKIVKSINGEREIEKMAYEEKVKAKRRFHVTDAFRVLRIQRTKERKKRDRKRGEKKSREKKLKEREVSRVSRSLWTRVNEKGNFSHQLQHL